VHTATELALEGDEIEMLRQALRKEHREGYRVRNAPLIAYAQILANYTSVGWTGTQHTTDFTELAAFGPGSEEIGCRVQNNALFATMTRALGLTVPT
jgi:alkaline phosphatase